MSLAKYFSALALYSFDSYLPNEATIFKLGNYDLELDEYCQLKISRSGNVLFLADASELIDAGVGTVDYDPRNIIVNGHQVQLPIVLEESKPVGCPMLTKYDYYTLEGSLDIPVITETQTDYYRVRTQAKFYEIDDQVKIEVKILDGDADYIGLRYRGFEDEAFYGIGLQPSVWNFKGRTVPIVTVEGGVGRGLEPMTTLLNTFAGHIGGNEFTTYSASWSYISSRKHHVYFDTSAIGHIEFGDLQTKVVAWHENVLTMTLGYGQTLKELAGKQSISVGTMKPLPSWTLDGAIVALQGGQDEIDTKYEYLKSRDVPMAGLWMQDWVGKKQFEEGERLLWNWQLNKDHYPNWDQSRQKWAEDGVRPFVYINPMISNITGDFVREHQFKIAADNGYFLQKSNGEPYILKSISIELGIVDLWNPEARTWLKNIIRTNLIEEAGAWGWMHDFGEYMPFDAYSVCGKDPFLLHNEYPDQWTRVVEEAINESNVEHADQILTFMRAGSTFSPGHNRLYWMGDQIPTFDGHDGMKSALVAQLNGGMSGFTLGHSDIGGYTAVDLSSISTRFEAVTRTKEVLLRWIEMSTFSDMVMRTHIGTAPKTMHQVWTDEETTDFFAKFVNIHVSLKDYKLELMEYAEVTGIPPVRAMMLEFESDENTWPIDDQFMLGSQIMMAPIFQSESSTRDVYFPEGEWEHFFTEERFNTSGWQRDLDAPLGQPLVFWRVD